MSRPNFDAGSSKFAIQELNFSSLAWGSFSEGEPFPTEGSGLFRLARVISQNNYDAAVVEKLDINGSVTGAIFLDQGVSGVDIFEVLSTNSDAGSQPELTANYYHEATSIYTDFALELSGHPMGGALANYTLAKVIAEGGVVPEAYTFAAQGARAAIDADSGNSASLAGYTNNFITESDYSFSESGASPLYSFLDTNLSGGSFTDQYVLPKWDGVGGNNSYTQIFLDTANPDSIEAYDNPVLGTRGGSTGTILQGSSARNSIYGNWGDDVLVGVAGADNLWGEEGADVFTYTQLSDLSVSSIDIIRDFASGQDKIDISTLFGGGFGILYVSVFSNISGQATLSYDQTSNSGSLSIDSTGDSSSNFIVRLIGQVKIIDITIRSLKHEEVSFFILVFGSSQISGL